MHGSRSHKRVHPRARNRRGQSFQRFRQARGCIGTAVFAVLLLLMSVGLFHKWPSASLSSAYDLGTDDGPAKVRLQEVGIAKEDDADEENGVVVTSPLGAMTYASMVGESSGGRRGADFAASLDWKNEWQIINSSVTDLGLPAPLRIFVYELPPSFNTDFLENPRCASHLFAAEVAIHRALLQSPVRTLEPNEADFFFLPVYTACDFNTANGFPNLSRAPELIRTAIEHVAAAHPFWNRADGRDHVVVASHDFGACFHAMEKEAIKAGIPPFLKNSIILQTFGQTNQHPCQQVNHIQIPPYVSPPLASTNWQPVEKQNRTIFAYMSGKIELHPKESFSGELYGRGVRTEILKRYKRDKRFLIRRKRAAAYYEEMLHSRFCLCPRGWAPWSPRIVESVLFGCIPVIIADNIKLPFDTLLNWSAMGIVLQEDQVSNLATILESLSEDKIASMQHEIWREEVRRTLMFLEPSIKGDATWQVLDALARKKMERDKNIA